MFRFLTYDEVLLIHTNAIELYGGSPGVRDIGLLESALAAPMNLAAYELSERNTLKSVARLGAAYWFHISMNHPFIDGNKRVSLMSALAFLHLNGWDLKLTYSVGLDLSIALATHSLDREELAQRLEASLVPLPP